jgi:Holliday junction DNA helicase RuvA
MQFGINPKRGYSMFEFISGKLAQKSPVSAVVECAGVGYLFTISLTTYHSLPQTGADIKLLAHLVHREDSMELYGFATPEEREFFKKLMSVTRIGPKLAIAILSGSPPQRLAECIVSGDIATLSKIPRVGKKTAERIIMELGGKIESASAIVVPGDNLSLVINALVALGFSQTEAYNSACKAKKNSPDASVDELIRIALAQ